MTKLELQNKIATIEKSMAKITNPAVLAIAEKNLKQAREQLAALEGATPSPAPSGGGSELEKLYEQREKLKKGLQSSNAVVQKASRMALPKIEAQIAELEGASPAPAPARRMPKPKAEKPAKAPAKRGRKPKAELPAEEKPKIKRGRKPKAETPTEAPAKTPAKRGRKPKAQAPAEAPAVTPARRGRPALPKGAKSQEVSLNSLTKLANAIVEFCNENGIANPTIDDVRGILGILDKGKALKFAKGGKISRSGKYLSKWQIKQILTDGGMKIGSDEILSGVWLKKKVDAIAEMRMGGGVGYFALKDDIIESGKPVMYGNRRISPRNPKVVGVLQGKMVGGLMKVYDFDDNMWKVVDSDEWQQAYAEGGAMPYLGSKVEIVKNLDEYDGYVAKTILSVESYDDMGYYHLEDSKGNIYYVNGKDIAVKQQSDGAYEKEIAKQIAKAKKDVQQMQKMIAKGKFAKGGGVGDKKEKEKLRNLAYQLQNADEGWIRNNHSKFVQMQNDYKNQFKKVYGHSNYENPNDYANGGGVGNFTLADYKANEEINHHSENALMLTKMYGTQEEINEVERLIRKGKREFGFSMEDYRRLYEISNKYYKHLVEASKRK